MKRISTIVLAIILMLTLTSCRGNNHTSFKSNESNLDLTGSWKQANSNSETSYQVARIADDTIEIYWKSDDDTLSLYWAGTYKAPTSGANEFSWDSESDKSRTRSAFFASVDDTKTFTHKDGVISYSVSLMGTTTTVQLERSDDIEGLTQKPVQKAVSTEDLLPLELVDSGFVLLNSSDSYFIQYAVIVHNPNAERAVRFTRIRLTARDADGMVLGTEEITGTSILPGGTLSKAFLGPKVDSKPTTVDFEIISPDDSDWISPDVIYDNVGESLIVENPTKRKDKIVGEIYNPNDFDLSSIYVVILFRNNNGELTAGDTKHVSKVSAGGKVPFEFTFRNSSEAFVTDNFEIYAYPIY